MLWFSRILSGEGITWEMQARALALSDEHFERILAEVPVEHVTAFLQYRRMERETRG